MFFHHSQREMTSLLFLMCLKEGALITANWYANEVILSGRWSECQRKFFG